MFFFFFFLKIRAIFFFFFFFKQKTAYEIFTSLEFRRVLFRSILAAFGLDTLLQWVGRWVRRGTRCRRRLPLRYGVASALTLTVVVQMHLFSQQVMRHQPNDPAVSLPETPLIQVVAG